MQLMKEGDKWELYIPSNLAYGPRQMGPIPANAVLIFELELLQVKGKSKILDEL
jgi:FKBP-type peptidyl-prolyl cis-trans isomerase FklB